MHGLEKTAGIPPSRLGWACAIGAFAGAGLIMLFMWWTSAVEWAVDIGGKSFSSIPAFVPVTFEVGVLFGALGTVAAFFIRSRLWPGKKARTPAGATDDTFVVVVPPNDAGFDPDAARRIADRHGVGLAVEGGS